MFPRHTRCVEEHFREALEVLRKVDLEDRFSE
jgi:hypothetical protein